MVMSLTKYIGELVKKLSKLGLTAVVLSLSFSVNAKGLFDGLINTAINAVIETVSNPNDSSTFKTPYKSKCSYTNKIDHYEVSFECIGDYTDTTDTVIAIKTKEPVAFSSDSGADKFTSFIAQESSDGNGWQIYGIGKNNQRFAIHHFAYATGGGAGAPETLGFHNGDDVMVLAINVLNPLGE